MKAMALQTLVPEDEAVALPEQELELVAPPVDEAKQRGAHRLQLHRLLDQKREPIDLPSHVHRCAVQIHPLNPFTIRAQHRTDPTPARPPTPPPATARTRSA